MRDVTSPLNFFGVHNFYDGLEPSSSFLGPLISFLWFLRLFMVQKSLYLQLPPIIMESYIFFHTMLHTTPWWYSSDSYCYRRIQSRVNGVSNSLYFLRYTPVTYHWQCEWSFCFPIRYRVIRGIEVQISSHRMVESLPKPISKLRVSVEYDNSWYTMQSNYLCNEEPHQMNNLICSFDE